jgi:hypothetical protein
LNIQTYYRYTAELIEKVGFSLDSNIPLSIAQYSFSEGHIFRYRSLHINRYTPRMAEKVHQNPDTFLDGLQPLHGYWYEVENYHWIADRVQQIDRYFKHNIEDYREEKLHYDTSNVLTQILVYDPIHTPYTLYRRRPAEQGFLTVEEQAISPIIDGIVARLKTVPIREPLYCLHLSYHFAGHHFPPILVLGTQAYRQECLRTGKPGAIFYPAMQGRRAPEIFLRVEDQAALDRCQQLEQIINERQNFVLAQRTLRKIAAILTHYPWQDIIPTTPDFVVFAADQSLEETSKTLRFSASPEQIQLWEAQGWL